MKTKAAVAHANNAPMTIETVELRLPEGDEVLVEMKASGICHTDLSVLEGNFPLPLPRILGHEGAGVVLQVGSQVTRIKVGDHVIINSNPECGDCATCHSEKTNFCSKTLESRTFTSPFTWQGKPLERMGQGATFASHTVIKDYYLSPIPKDVPFESACLVGCGVMTGIGAVLFNAKVEKGSTVVIMGMGSIGLNAVQAAKLAQASRIIALDTNPEKEAAAKLFGATDFVNPKDIEGSLVKHIYSMLGQAADYAFECVGNVELIKFATEMVNPFWGVCLAVGVPPHSQEIKLPAASFYFGRTLKGTSIGDGKPVSDTPKIIDWYQQGDILLDELVTHRLKLDEINKGFDLLRKNIPIRSVIIY